MTTAAPPSTPLVTLTVDELIHAGSGGMRRHLDHLLRGRGDGQFRHRDSWQHHVCGAMAEMAVAKYLGKWWFPFYDDPFSIEADVGSKWQVRSQEDRSDREPFLVVRERDRDDQAFLLVSYAIPRFRLHGWCWGREAKQDDYAQPASGGKPPCWFVPAPALRPMP